MTLVFLFHVNAKLMGPLLAAKDEPISLWWAFVRAGDTGVSLFFVLSGFLLSLPFLTEAAGGARVSRRRFFLRRALRILPLYYVAVFVAVVLTAKQAADLLRAFPHLLFLTYVPGWGVLMPPYSNTWWSLSTEAQYYLLLPLLPLALRSRWGRWIGLAALLAYAIAYATFMFGMWHMGSVTGTIGLRLSLFGRAPLLLWGILVAYVYHRGAERIRGHLHAIPLLVRGGADMLLLIVVVALGLLLRWTAQQGPNGAEAVPFLAWHILEGLLWAIILVLMLLAPLRLKPLIANRLFGYLGIVSYSMYMWHTAVLFWIPHWLGRAGWRWSAGWNLRTSVIALLVTVASLAISQITYMLIERPFLARKARID